MNEMKREKMMDKIAGLFRLAENNPSEEESNAALARAKKLLIQYQLNEMEVRDRDNRSGTKDQDDLFQPDATWVEPPQSRMHKWILSMATAISIYFDVKHFYYEGNTSTKMKPKFIFYGIKTNCEVAAFAFHSIYKQILKLGKKYKPSKQDFLDQDYYTSFSIFSVQARMEYRLGLTRGLVSRAWKERRKKQENKKVTALAIRADDVADKWLESSGLELKETRLRSHAYGTNTDSYNSGLVDADKIDIHGRGLNPKSSINQVR